MPATLRIAASTIGCLAAAALLGATGALDRLRVPSDPVITESWAPGVPRVPTRFGRDDDGSWIVATPKHTHLVEQDGETVALASDEAVAVTWATRTRPNPEPNAYGELWLAGFRPRPVRPTAANWPDRSVLAILATEDTQPAWRRFAWEALDRGTFDLVWVGGSAVLSELFRELFLGLPPDDPDAQLVVIAPAGQDLSPAPLPRRYAFVPASKPDQLLLPAEREPRPIRELWPTAQPEDTTAVLASWFPLDMVRIPKGVLRSDDESSPLHNTEVDKFLISRFEVTRGDWFRLGLAEPKNDHGEGFYPKGELPKHPANNVNWFDALQFCNALSDRDGLTPAYYRDEEFTQVWQDRKTDGDTVHWDPNANGYRLPTEAEWEYAIRSNANPPARFYWGSNVERASEFAWFTKNSGDEPQAVDQKLRNDFGLSDMAGNVWEWCWDSYDDSGPGVRRVLRGGAYVVNVEALASSIGSWDRPEFRGRSFGFRCVRSAHPRHGSNR